MPTRYTIFIILAGIWMYGACTSTSRIPVHSSEIIDPEGLIEYQEAQVLFEDGELVRSRDLLLNVIELYPGYFRAHRLLQEIKISQEGPEENLMRAQDAVSVQRDALTLTLLARAEPDPEDKIGLLREALSLDETYAWAHYGLAYTFLKVERLGEYENARSHLETALAYAPGLSEARRLLIENLHRLGDVESEAEQYRLLLEQAPDDLEARYNFADLLQGKLDDPEEALDHLEWVLEREPDRLDALLLKGVILCQLSEFSKAETLYHRLVRRHPDALLNLAFLYRDFMDAPDKALVYFQRYLDYSGENAEDKAFIDQEILVPNLIESLKKETL